MHFSVAPEFYDITDNEFNILKKRKFDKNTD